MKKNIIITLSCIVCLGLAGCESQEMKDAKEAFNAEVERIESEENELDEEIKNSQDYIAEDLTPLDETKITDLEQAIKEAKENKKDIPEIPKDEEEVKKVTEDTLKKMEYKTTLEKVRIARTDLENSVKQFEQLTNPTSDFVMERLKDVTLVTGMSAITEDTDPYGDLNKAKSYSGIVFFTSSLVDQDEVYVDEASSYGDIYVDKGTDAGGCVEIFTTVEDATTRDNYLGEFDGTILSGGKHVVVGTLVVRTSNLLPLSKQTELETALIEALAKL